MCKFIMIIFTVSEWISSWFPPHPSTCCHLIRPDVSWVRLDIFMPKHQWLSFCFSPWETEIDEISVSQMVLGAASGLCPRKMGDNQTHSVDKLSLLWKAHQTSAPERNGQLQDGILFPSLLPGRHRALDPTEPLHIAGQAQQCWESRKGGQC